MLIALTGLGTATYRGQAQDAGFDHFLVNPVAPGDLQELLEGIARQRGASALTRQDAAEEVGGKAPKAAEHAPGGVAPARSRITVG